MIADSPSRQNPCEPRLCSSLLESKETTAGGRQWHLVCLCVLLSVTATDTFPRLSMTEDEDEDEAVEEDEDEDPAWKKDIEPDSTATDLDRFLFRPVIFLIRWSPPFSACDHRPGIPFRVPMSARPNGLESKTSFSARSDIKFRAKASPIPQPWETPAAIILLAMASSAWCPSVEDPDFHFCKSVEFWRYSAAGWLKQSHCTPNYIYMH